MGLEMLTSNQFFLMLSVGEKEKVVPSLQGRMQTPQGGEGPSPPAPALGAHNAEGELHTVPLPGHPCECPRGPGSGIDAKPWLPSVPRAEITAQRLLPHGTGQGLICPRPGKGRVYVGSIHPSAETLTLRGSLGAIS